ncbi:hypothetical protein CLAFUW4_14811 [Fulvia fulva]|nr:hypothetical protein CLAFUR0_14803 [Fulvia fulva]WPV23017.1 hypothetical protein CLAFUW4_14811 [Fulvia fulva]WPV37962.1 hypothetical protein CLAFUW7_14812 [Fulvia fulva]
MQRRESTFSIVIDDLPIDPGNQQDVELEVVAGDARSQNSDADIDTEIWSAVYKRSV